MSRHQPQGPKRLGYRVVEAVVGVVASLDVLRHKPLATLRAE